MVGKGGETPCRHYIPAPLSAQELKCSGRLVLPGRSQVPERRLFARCALTSDHPKRVAESIRFRFTKGVFLPG